MPYVALPTKSPGDVLTSALWNTYLQGNADSGFMRMIADSTLVGATATIDFTSIPATFGALLLILYGRTDRAATLTDTVGIRFNGDTGTNYNFIIGQVTGSAAAPGTSVAQTAGFAATCPAATGVASAFAATEILIPHYAGAANHKMALSRNVNLPDDTGGANYLMEVNGTRWKSAAAINRVTLISRNGANFVAGTRATLLGVPV